MDESDCGAYASPVPSREAVLGFLFGVAAIAIAAGLVFGIPGVIGSVLIWLIFGGWIFFSNRDRRRTSS
jgi:hypothetical protein